MLIVSLHNRVLFMLMYLWHIYMDTWQGHYKDMLICYACLVRIFCFRENPVWFMSIILISDSLPVICNRGLPLTSSISISTEHLPVCYVVFGWRRVCRKKAVCILNFSLSFMLFNSYFTITVKYKWCCIQYVVATRGVSGLYLGNVSFFQCSRDFHLTFYPYMWKYRACTIMLICWQTFFL
jgi:hypothetical protein